MPYMTKKYHKKIITNEKITINEKKKCMKIASIKE